MNDRCQTCGWLFTDDQWDHAAAEGFTCPIPLEPEPSSPRRNWSWVEAQFAHLDRRTSVDLYDQDPEPGEIYSAYESLREALLAARGSSHTRAYIYYADRALSRKDAVRQAVDRRDTAGDLAAMELDLLDGTDILTVNTLWPR